MTEALQEHPKCGFASLSEKVQDAEGVGKESSVPTLLLAVFL